jgi:hypothetical protein
LSEKKTVPRSAATGLACLCIITLVILSFSLYSLWQTNNVVLEQNAQIVDLSKQNPTPHLISNDFLNCTDNTSDPNAPFLHVTGFVVNVGNATANNCKVHIIAYQNNNVVAINASKNISNLAPGGYVAVDLIFNYTGSALVSTLPSLEWTI